MSSIYLDNAATTRPLPENQTLLQEASDTLWYNPSALYGPAVRVRRELEEAREELESAFGSWGHRCLYTSGGTEGANMVVRYGARRRKNGVYVCGGYEHPCVEESFRVLADAGNEVRFVPVQPDGSIRIEDLLGVVDESTVLVSVMHVNNETGAVNDVAAMARAVKRQAPHAVFHSDGVQAFLRVAPGDAEAIDYYTVSAHKVHGLRGTGAVLYGPRTPLKAMLVGGGQEGGLRSGTENVLGALSLAASVQYFTEHADEIQGRLSAMQDVFLEELAGAPGFTLVSPEEGGAPHILSFAVDGVRGETLMHALERDGIYISMGSACSSKKSRKRAAQALGVPEQTAGSMIRISTSPFNTIDEAYRASESIRAHADVLRTATGT